MSALHQIGSVLTQLLTGAAPGAAAAGLAATRSVRAAELLAGTGQEDITPPRGFPNVAIKDADFDEVLSPLYARALVLSDGRSKIAVLQWDLLTTGDDAVAHVRALVSAATGIPAGNILVNAAHSHSSPLAPGAGNSKTPANEARVGEKPSLSAQWTERLFSASVAAAQAANASLRNSRRLIPAGPTAPSRPSLCRRIPTRCPLDCVSVPRIPR